MSSDSPQTPKLHDSVNERNTIEEVFRLYSVLASEFPLHLQSGLGGKLLYAGQIGQSGGNALLYAANIAGAASLGASSDPIALRQALRDGVIDFLVNSLEEALRILKNEVRKRQTVSAGVSGDPHLLVEQMLDRGVLPDLLPPASGSGEASPSHPQAEKFLAHGSKQIAHSKDREIAIPGAFVTWSITSTVSTIPAVQNFSRWLPRLDACVQGILPADDLLRRRWLRLAPRYLGRLAQRQHGMVLTAYERLRFESEVGHLVARHRNEGEESMTVTIT